MSERGETALKTSLSQAARYPTGTSLLYTALDYALGPNEVVVLTPSDDRQGVKEMLDALRNRFLPRTLVLLADPDDQELNRLTPLLQGKKTLDDKTTAYLCRGETCRAPTTSAEELIALLDS